MQVHFFIPTDKGTYEWSFKMKDIPQIGDIVNLVLCADENGQTNDYKLRCKVVSREWRLKHYGGSESVHIGVTFGGHENLFAKPIEFVTDCEMPTLIDPTKPREKD
jgi:hypothetical protein